MMRTTFDSPLLLRFCLTAGLLGPLLVDSRSAQAQARFESLYELGISTTDLGPDEGQSMFGYGFGLSGSYGFRRESSIGLVAGGDLVVRGFGLDVPGRLVEEVGVFQQADLLLDQFVAARIKWLTAGLYLEQRRIDRGTEAGSIGFPASGVGVMGRASAGRDGRFELGFSYAGATGGRLRLQGVLEEPEVESGRSLRISGRYPRTFGVRGEYSDTKFAFEPGGILGSFFDHRQRGLYVGLVLGLWGGASDDGENASSRPHAGVRR
jgi:hypothetical protein